jgi:hypothetical protein
MIFTSSSIVHAADYSSTPAVWKVTIPLRSRYDGDTNQIRGIQARALSAETNDISSTSGPHDVSSATTVVSPRYRSRLMHSIIGGAQISGAIKFGTEPINYGSQDVGVTNQAVVGSVTMMIKPSSSNLTISAGGSSAVILLASGVYTIAGTGFSAYLNGEPWLTSGTTAQTQRRFPFPRLLTIVFTSTQVAPVTVNGTGVLDFVTVSSRQPTASEVLTISALVYRKSISSAVLTDTVITNPFSDTLVSVPQTWNENLSS